MRGAGPCAGGHDEQVAALSVATWWSPVSAHIGANPQYVKRQMATPSRRGARVAHFPEGALSGYAGTDFETFAGFDWDRLGEATAEVAQHARQLGIWAVVGSGSAALPLRIAWPMALDLPFSLDRCPPPATPPPPTTLPRAHH